MKLLFTQQAVESLEEALNFISTEVSESKLEEIRDEIINKAALLINYPNMGKKEEYLEHLNLGHRALIQGNYKIIYRVQQNTIFVTDIFDTRQNPKKMRS